jgi:RNA polymerase-binding transcription factor DksA
MNTSFSKKDLEKFEKSLLEERKRLSALLDVMKKEIFERSTRDSSGDLSAYSFHMADLGTDAIDREREYMLASSEGQLLLEVDDALRKLYEGSFGKCEKCSKGIERTRLEAMPHARLCMKCRKEEDEARAQR